MNFGVKHGLCILLLMGAAVPAFAQQADPNDVNELGAGEIYALGNMALNDLKRGSDPLLQVERFFNDAKLPLTSSEARQVRKSIDTAVTSLQNAKDDAAVRKANQDFNRNLLAALTPDQQAALKSYRNEQIMMRGGAPALTLILDKAQTPLTSTQEQQVVALYKQFHQQADELTRAANGNPDKAQLDKLETDALAKVVQILTPLQRHSLAASRLGTLNAAVRSPR